MPTLTPVGWRRFFSSHDGDSDCRLFDQASHGNAAPALAAVVLPMVLSSFVLSVLTTTAFPKSPLPGRSLKVGLQASF